MNKRLLLFTCLVCLSNESILNYITLPNRYFNCLPDILTKEECTSLKGEWEEIDPTNCENKAFISKKTKIGQCCNMKCLSENGIIKVELENENTCKLNNSPEIFYGFKDYTPFNQEFLNNVEYTENNTEFMTFQHLGENKEILSVLCTFPTKQDFLKGLSKIMNQTFYYVFGGGRKDGPTKEKYGFDCARLVMFLLDKITNYEFDFAYTNSQKLYELAIKNNLILNISKEELKTGDVIFYQNITDNKIYHTVVYFGENKVFNAGHTGNKISIKNYYEPEDTRMIFADFINETFEEKDNKEENTEDNIIQGMTNTETDNSNSNGNNVIEEVDHYEIIKNNLALLTLLIIFL